MALPARRVSRVILVALVVAACEALAPPSPSPRPTAEAVIVPPPPGPPQVVACLGIDAADCALVAEAVQAALPPERGSPFAMRVQLTRCPDGTSPCPESLVARQGRVLVEYGDEAVPLEYRVSGTPAQPDVEIIEQVPGTWTDPIQPGSPPVEDAGPFPFEVGHCGLLHAVDFDGSFWVLVGDVPGDHPALGNAEIGAIRQLSQDRAEYLGTLNATIGLARFPGAKRFQPCR